MSLLSRKIASFVVTILALPDKPNASLGLTADQLKAKWDASPEELRTAINGIIDDLMATADGASGADQIGATSIITGTGETVQAILDELALISIPPGKNYLTNANFNIWQRDISFVYPTGEYTADRWTATGGAGNLLFSKWPVLLSGSPFGVQFAQIGGAAGGDAPKMSQIIDEGQKYINGNQITISFSAMVDSSFPITSLVVEGVGASTVSETVAITVDDDWHDYTATLDFTGDNPEALDFELNFEMDNVDAFQIYFAKIKLELGTIATPFVPKSDAEDLIECQAYYTILSKADHSKPIGYGIGVSTTAFRMEVPLSVQLRDAPVVTTTDLGTGGFVYAVGGGGSIDLSSTTPSVTLENGRLTLVYTGLTGVTAETAYILTLDDYSIEFDAEIY